MKVTSATDSAFHTGTWENPNMGPWETQWSKTHENAYYLKHDTPEWISMSMAEGNADDSFPYQPNDKNLTPEQVEDYYKMAVSTYQSTMDEKGYEDWM